VISPLKRMRALVAAGAVALLLLGGCASTGDPRDPLEPMNRAVYKFNDGVDALFLRPAAEFYRAIVPDVFRLGIGNFFSNINDVIVALNNLLQGKVPEAIGDVGRIFVNTTLGIFGVRDVATELGIPKNNEDFGQTLGRWGLRDGPYIVLPFLGPSSVRDTAGWVGDIYSSPLAYIDPVRDRNLIIGFRFVTVRADLLDASAILETAALDPYEFVRDAYLQRRRNLVYDGNPPEDKDHFQPTGADVKAKNGVKEEPKPAGKPEAKPDAKPEVKPKPEGKPVSGNPAEPAASAGSSSPDPRYTRVWLPENR
jgi:phospholipid-binding lipoprotein MlaA